MSEVFSLWIMLSLVSISSNFPFQVDLNTSPSASLNKARTKYSHLLETLEHYFRCHHSSPPASQTSSYPILLPTPSSLEVCICSLISPFLCHSETQLSFPFKSASHLCTRISPFVYPRFKLKMQSGVKFEIKQWCSVWNTEHCWSTKSFGYNTFNHHYRAGCDPKYHIISPNSNN